MCSIIKKDALTSLFMESKRRACFSNCFKPIDKLVFPIAVIVGSKLMRITRRHFPMKFISDNKQEEHIL